MEMLEKIGQWLLIGVAVFVVIGGAVALVAIFVFDL